MKPAESVYYFTTDLVTDLLDELGAAPEIAIQLPLIYNPLSGLPHESYAAMYETGRVSFPLKGMHLYMDAKPLEKYVRVGTVTSDAGRFIYADDSWWLICEAALTRDFVARNQLRRYINCLSPYFMHTMYGRFIAMNGFRKGNGWTGILLSQWPAQYQNDPETIAASEALNIPLLRAVLRTAAALRSYARALALWRKNPVFLLTMKARGPGFWKYHSLFPVAGGHDHVLHLREISVFEEYDSKTEQ